MVQTRCGRCGIVYFFDKFGEDADGSGSEFEEVCGLFQSANLFRPAVAASTADVVALGLIEGLAVYKAISKDLIKQMKKEWTDYKAAAAGIDEGANVLAFFQSRQETLKAFGEAAQLLAVMPSSSAAAERVFSLLRHMFGKRTESTLEDKCEAGTCISMNNRAI